MLALPKIPKTPRSLAQAAGVALGASMVPVVTALARVADGLGRESFPAALLSGCIFGVLLGMIVTGLLAPAQGRERDAAGAGAEAPVQPLQVATARVRAGREIERSLRIRARRAA